MGPQLGTLQDGSVHVRMSFGDRRLRDEAGRCVRGWRRCRTATCWGNAVLPWCCRKVAGGGRWLSPLLQSALEPLEHSVPEVILERSSGKKLSALDPLEHSGLDQAGPVGRQFAYVAGRYQPVVAAGGSSSVGTANPVGSDGPVITGGPIGPCETLSPNSQSALEPLEHSVPEVVLEGSSRRKLSALEPLEHSVPDTVLKCSSRRKLSSLDPLEHSGLDQAGPVGRNVAEGPAGPKKTLLGLDPLEHSGLDRADPAGRLTVIGPVGLFGTLSPSDCYPAGLAGPYVAGGPVGPDEKFLDPFWKSSGSVRAFGSRPC